VRDILPLAERLAPDTVTRLERAALQRFTTAEVLRAKRPLAALYLYGYAAEICLAAAYFRCAGFPSHAPIDRDTRRRRMAQARQLRTFAGEPLMTSDPHPLVGWARFLEWQRLASGDLPAEDSQRLREAIHKAISIYNYWRPELRYKTLDIADEQLDEVRRAAKWLIDNRARL
jgi:hypothetical protein